MQAIFTVYGEVKTVTVLPTTQDNTAPTVTILMEDSKQAEWIMENVNGKTPAGLSAPLNIRRKDNTEGSSPPPCGRIRPQGR